MGKCMVECDKQGASSIVFPALGTGNLKFPVATTARVMVDEICSYLQKNKCESLSKVYIMIYKDNAMFRNFSDELEKRKQGEVLVPMKRKTRAWFSRGNHAAPPQTELKAAKPLTSHSLDFGNGVSMEIVKGDITAESTDVIVNTTSQSLSLDSGVSLALAKKAGKALKEACAAVDLEKKKGLEVGKIVETTAGNLKCRCVFHMKFQKHNFVKVVSTCIERARELKYSSIAFPAIGTGNERYPADTAAEDMIKGMKQCMASSRLHVRVVLFLEEVYSKFVQVVESREVSLPGSAKVEVDSSSSESDTLEHYETPADAEFGIRIFGETQEQVSTAEKSVHKLIDDNFKLEKISDKNVSLLTESQIKALRQAAVEMDVVFRMNRKSNTIELEGYVKSILEMQVKVTCAFAKVERAESTMKTVQWKRQDSTALTNYDLLLNLEIEEHKDKATHTVKDDTSGEHFTIDYQKMVEIDHTLGERTRSIHRIPECKCVL